MGAVALSVLMMPIVVRSTEEMLRIVPNGAARGVLRARRPQVADDHRRSCCRRRWRGIVTGVMLAIARIIGETAPLLITAGVLSRSTRTRSRPDGEPAGVRLQPYKSPGVPPEP